MSARARWTQMAIATLLVGMYMGGLVNAAGDSDIGPLPARKAPDAKAVEMGKRLFLMTGSRAMRC